MFHPVVLGVVLPAALTLLVTAWRRTVAVLPPPPRLPRPGDLLRIASRLRAVFFRGLDAAARASARRLIHHGVSARAYASPNDVTRIGRSHNPIVVIAEVGRAAVRRAARHLPEGERGLLRGVTIGDRRAPRRHDGARRGDGGADRIRPVLDLRDRVPALRPRDARDTRRRAAHRRAPAERQARASRSDHAGRATDRRAADTAELPPDL